MEHTHTTSELDFSIIQPCLGWAPLDVIKKTFKATTQYARNVYRIPFKKHYKSHFPALNVHRRSEAVATDTISSDTAAVYCGHMYAQIFVGKELLVTDVYGVKTDGEFFSTLEENIRFRGAMESCFS